MTLLAGALSLCLASGVSFDAERHSVTVEAKATGCNKGAFLEFMLVGPTSDNGYESMFTTVATPTEIADAFDKAGIPRGLPIDTRAAAFWPAGKFLEMSPAFGEFVEDRDEIPKEYVYAGGRRDANGLPVATTNEPSAVFALYGCAQSLIQIDDNLDQSATYGRFRAAVQLPEGEVRRITYTWKGGEDWRPYALRVEPGRSAEALIAMKEASASNELSVTVSFSPEMKVCEAASFALSLSVVDSVRAKINGAAPGEFFYRAFLPQESWRDRKKRLCQPPEVHFLADGLIRVVEIKEDWSGDEETIEPKLSESVTDYADVADAARAVSKLSERTSAALIFAAPDQRLDRLYDLKKAVTCDVMNWYVFQSPQP